MTTLRERALLVLALVVLGAGWGVTQPLAKIAVSEGYRNFGIIFWQLVIGAVCLGAILLVRGRWPRVTRARLFACTVIALIGTVLPNTASYQAAVYLPAGVLSILLSAVPMIAFPVALAFGLDRFAWGRLAGLMTGLVGVLILTVPEASLPDPAMAAFVPLAMIAPICYALEGNGIARFGTAGLDPVELLFGASVIGAVLALPAAMASATFIDPLHVWRGPDWAILASSLVHAVVYTSYFWLIGRAGSVFAVQVSYLVTGFGVLWAILLLGEQYTGAIWTALALMVLGMFLVQPRPVLPLVEPAPSRQDAV
ncbi:DMT family transporter [Anianabacter salinae]|uniref:DMT family transporter n=1 Tax=Anianabacter salinae TaxID=2851023 RepID=UPI00225E3C9B|nr:DMT family transporter [Anianabacter salinae]MBV0913876.1 DMT family transporter [Anianabacter salinae]